MIGGEAKAGVGAEEILDPAIGFRIACKADGQEHEQTQIMTELHFQSHPILAELFRMTAPNSQ